MTTATAPPDVQGAALGYLWATGAVEDASAQALQGVRLGDTLAGLFAVAREEVVSHPLLLAGVDARLAQLSEDAFLEELPALRQAFGYFPPRERDRIARQVLGLHGQEHTSAHALRRKLAVSPETLKAAHALWTQVEARCAQWGLP